MVQTKTITIANSAVMQLLQQLAALKLIGFVDDADKANEIESVSSESPITAKLNEIYAHIDSSVPDDIMAAQMEVLEDDDW
jgi:hypothetical protein